MNLVLIGFMASGKTSVGRRVAKRLGYRYLDTDKFIEAELGCTIAELFQSKGEVHFRELETRLAGRLAVLSNSVIATGGGMPITPGNLDLLRKAGLVVFLKAETNDIILRLERDTRRPKVQGVDLRATVEGLYGQRMPVYSQADVIIPTGGKSINQVAGDVIREVARAASKPQAAQPVAPTPA